MPEGGLEDEEQPKDDKHHSFWNKESGSYGYFRLFPLMSTTEPPQYPPDCLPYRTLSMAAMWEIGIMEKWVEDFARCEELVDEILEKVSLVITYENQEVEKGSP